MLIREALAAETLQFVRNWVQHCAKPHKARLAFPDQVTVHRMVNTFTPGTQRPNTIPAATINFTEDYIEYTGKGVDIQFEYADPNTMDKLERLIKNL